MEEQAPFGKPDYELPSYTGEGSISASSAPAIDADGLGVPGTGGFHRVIPGFVIQGGDPNSKSHEKARHGTGGPDYRLKAEFNFKRHKRGTLSMARSSDPDSAGSQFFICVSSVSSLDEKYTVFGEVTKGMDVVDKIVSLPRDGRDNPLKRVEIKVEIVGPKGG